MRGALSAASWERGVVRTLALLATTVAHDPVLARLGFVELLAPGRPGLELRERIFTEWTERLCQLAPPAARPGEVAAEASIAAVWEMAAAEVAAGRPGHLVEQVPGMAYFVLYGPLTRYARVDRPLRCPRDTGQPARGREVALASNCSSAAGARTNATRKATCW